ncbi:hypothetical protein D3C87_601190 [compost metagenome]
MSNNTSQVRKDLRELSDWQKGVILLGNDEIAERITELSKGRSGYSVRTYGLIKTAIVRAVTVSDDVISRMIKSN